jgi:hypothetical protein
MFTTQTRQKKSGMGGLKKPCRVCGDGLGASDEYSGINKSGEIIQTAGSVLYPVTGMLPIKSLPIIGNLDPLTMTLAVMTGGITLIPGVSKIVGGLFKKATHMGDCMKWWSSDSNIRSMVASVMPYPIDVVQSYPEASQEYQIQHASSVISDSGIQRALAVSSRKYKIGTYYVQGVKQNADLMQMSCMTQPEVQKETGVVISASDVGPYFTQLQEQARQIEYQETMTNIGKVLASYQRVVEQKAVVVKKTRDVSATFQMPVGVTSISKGGSLVLSPGTSSNLVIDRGVVGKSIIRKK